MKLQDRLYAFTAELIKGGKIPESLVVKLLEGIKDQVASGSADRALKAGDVAPAFKLKDAEGVSVSSAELLSHGPLVASFYRGVWCPYCNLEFQALDVIGRDGVIAYAEVIPDYTHRPDPSDLFPILDQLVRSSAA